MATDLGALATVLTKNVRFVKGALVEAEIDETKSHDYMVWQDARWSTVEVIRAGNQQTFFCLIQFAPLKALRVFDGYLGHSDLEAIAETPEKFPRLEQITADFHFEGGSRECGRLFRRLQKLRSLDRLTLRFGAGLDAHAEALVGKPAPCATLVLRQFMASGSVQLVRDGDGRLARLKRPRR